MEMPEEIENPLKSEHLNEGVSPIMGCVGTPEQFDNFKTENADILHAHNVNYYEDPQKLKENKFKNQGKNSYVISPIDSLNKFSTSFRNCIGLIVTGQDKETGENISFLSHQDPDSFLGETREHFLADLKQQLSALKERSVSGTIDAVIVGGDYYGIQRQKEYVGSIGLVADEVQNLLGFEPVVMTGPKINWNRWIAEDDVFYDNGHRRLYIRRPDVGDASTESYLPSDVIKKWPTKDS